jgi:hypothetical protein
MWVRGNYTPTGSTDSGLAATAVGMHVNIMVISHMLLEVFAEPFEGATPVHY